MIVSLLIIERAKEDLTENQGNLLLSQHRLGPTQGLQLGPLESSLRMSIISIVFSEQK
jgi:hypothetical protein